MKRVAFLKKSGFKKGNIPWNKGLKTGIVPKTAFKKGHVPWIQDKTHSLETRKKLSEIAMNDSRRFERAKKAFLSLKKQGFPNRVGKLHSRESKIKISEHRMGKAVGGGNSKWRGDNVGYYALHSWISRVLGKPTICSNCGMDGLSEHKIHWANISRKYRRDKLDWVRLCAKCHYRFDRVGGLYV